MELGVGMWIFFGVISFMVIALSVISSIDGFSEKFFNYFKEENK